jgi:hypothetical protein
MFRPGDRLGRMRICEALQAQLPLLTDTEAFSIFPPNIGRVAQLVRALP